MAIDKELLDQLLAGRDPQELFGKDRLLDELKKALSERMLSAELDDHLENEAEAGGTNRRNGSSAKTVLTDTSRLTLAIPRDRAGTFDPKLIAKYQRRFPGFDEKIVSMYARGMTVRQIRGHLEELYGIDVSPDLISTITDAVLETVAEWQGRPLDSCYPLVFFDAIRVKIRDEGFVRNKAVYIALAILPDGAKEILGIWIEQTEGAQFWLRVMNELKNRGVADILIAVVDGLKGFPEAINAVFPATIVQTCIVHLIRNSMGFASWKDRKLIAQSLRSIYRAETADAGRAALDAFDESHWGRKYPAIAQSWRRHWEHVIPFFAFPEGVRRIIYTTNAIEALNSKLRRAVRTRGHFPGDDAAMKLLYLVLNQAAEEWKRAPREWFEAKVQFAVIFGERFSA
ncbi:transposase [Sphingomonas sp. Root710]|uniref:IS256 family transposase n=1 Tax=Sphingomonas sp. Root710 TaxID=1736594 RepID=UPI0006F7D3E5|nr:IS256 family transposase [Sphingomonas sp. Root710]KRB85315.1 transposase [Sphingomonas sp. Root710]